MVDRKKVEKSQDDLVRDFSKRLDDYIDQSGVSLIKLAEATDSYASKIKLYRDAHKSKKTAGLNKTCTNFLVKLSQFTGKSIDYWLTGEEHQTEQIKEFKKLIQLIKDEEGLTDDETKELVKIYHSATEHHPELTQVIKKILEIISESEIDYEKINQMISLIQDQKIKLFLSTTLM